MLQRWVSAAGLETLLCLPGRAGGGSQGEGYLSICTEFADLSLVCQQMVVDGIRFVVLLRK